MKATVVPNRNKIFASLTQAVALSAANANGNETDIALGIHAGDHAIYPDCRQEFRDADDAAFRIGNWEADKVGYFTPYLETDKLGILKDGQELVGRAWELSLMKFTDVLILHTSPILAVIATTNQHHLWKGSKHLSTWVWMTLYSTRTRLDQSIIALRKHMLKNY